MNHLPKIMALVLMVGCAPKAEPAKQKQAQFSDLRQAYDARLAAITWPDGWPSKIDCDALLWAGLASAAGVDVDLSLAEYEPGKMHRRPPPPCFENGEDKGSKSTISQDMLTGYLWAIWRSRDRDAAERLASYGEANAWVMGEGLKSRTIMRTNLQGILGRMLYQMSRGFDDRLYRRWFMAYLPVSEDYEQHIQAHGIILNAEIDEYLRVNNMDATKADPDHGASFALLDVSAGNFNRLKSLAEASPSDPLFHAGLGIYTGDMSPAIALLLDETNPPPTYVRGKDPAAYAESYWLFTANLVLRREPLE